jgi:hypothetical protein
VPPEIQRIRRGYVESFTGTFINDGLEHWDGADLDRNPWAAAPQPPTMISDGFVATRGKRVDALMKTRGVISSLCFVEIKTHATPLLAASAYRAGCWAAHSELSGAIAQVQGSVASAMDSLRGKLTLNDSDACGTAAVLPEATSNAPIECNLASCTFKLS